ncbi:hypothetical protein LMG6871_02924 [Ralstonia edaphis]|uniref:hypothetical protein n=1 Tax=Ralstonia edaphi TaxID=3058599 RepID=UPI0028F4EB97|nr:hypothetical protein [Ralstonia sp. LMG 6871]CAJ0719516.1 hypothetical protein LMG6871_02924 [Ralstonia sp. LMG 6871]
MRLYKKILLVFIALALFAGCNQQAMIERFAPKEESAAAQRMLSDLIAKNFGALDGQLDAGLKTPDTRDALEKMANAFPSARPKSVTLVGTETNTRNSVTTYNLTYEYEYPTAWLLANVMLQRKDGQLRIIGMHAYPEKQSLRETNAFKFAGKGFAHYCVLGLMIGIALFQIYVLVLCFRTPIAKRKWLWLLFISLGITRFFFNWTTGDLRFQLLSFAIPGVGGFAAGPYAPLILTFSIPVGAIVFLLRWRALVAGPIGAADSAQASS